ncbi:hypothetical protein [Mucilaginibacter sp.]
MKDFIKDKHLSADWIFAYQTKEQEKTIADQGMLHYLQLYDIANFPLF